VDPSVGGGGILLRGGPLSGGGGGARLPGGGSGISVSQCADPDPHHGLYGSGGGPPWLCRIARVFPAHPHQASGDRLLR
jgi:hypothetical protein